MPDGQIIRTASADVRLPKPKTKSLGAGAGEAEAALVRKVAVDRVALHAGPLGDRADSGPRGADGRMQGYRGVDNALTRLVLTLGAPLQLVFPSCRPARRANWGVTFHVESLHTYVH